jgi:N-acetylglucosamine-6-phosphate deacetylase
VHRFALIADEIFTGLRRERERAVIVEPPDIVEVVDVADVARFGPLEVVRLPPQYLLAPGFIDTQVNGGGAVLLNDQPNLAGIRTIAEAHRRFGTTGLLPTLITDAPEVIEQLASVARDALAIPGVLGFHLEGPHINPARKGAHRADLIRPLDEAGIERLLRFAGVGRSMVTLAPECVAPGQIERLVDSGLIVSLGHSDATAAQVYVAAMEGATGVTHLFNAMSQIGPREPGLVGAAFDLAGFYAGIIADGHHVHAANLRLAKRNLHARLMLVTDAMPSVGAAAASFELQGRTITLRDGRLTDDAGTLAGAHLTMVEAVCRLREARADWAESLAEALVAASLTPAAFLDLSDRLGYLQPGYQADLVAFDPRTGMVADTWVRGERAGRT